MFWEFVGYYFCLYFVIFNLLKVWLGFLNDDWGIGFNDIVWIFGVGVVDGFLDVYSGESVVDGVCVRWCFIDVF